MLVDDRERRVETHLFEADSDLSRAGLDVDRLDDAVKSLGGHVQCMSPRLHLLGGDRRVPNELTVEEDLRIRNVCFDTQCAEFRSGSDSCGRLSNGLTSGLPRRARPASRRFGFGVEALGPGPGVSDSRDDRDTAVVEGLSSARSLNSM